MIRSAALELHNLEQRMVNDGSVKVQSQSKVVVRKTEHDVRQDFIGLNQNLQSSVFAFVFARYVLM